MSEERKIGTICDFLAYIGTFWSLLYNKEHAKDRGQFYVFERRDIEPSPVFLS